jgi:hypothetical protein
MRRKKIASIITGIVTSTVIFAQAAIASKIAPSSFPWMNAGQAGKTYNMTDHPNAVFVFEAFSLNCSWCNKNAPNVDALASKFKDNARVQVIDLGLDTSDSFYTRWISTHKPNHPVVKDVGRKVYNSLQVENGIPQVFIVNCRGEREDVVVGYWGEAEKAQVEAAVNRALQTTCVPTAI